MARNMQQPGDKSNDALPFALSVALGLVALIVAIVAVTSNVPILALVSGIIATLLSATVGWVIQTKRQIADRLTTVQTDNIRLEAALSEQVKARLGGDAVPTGDGPVSSGAPGKAAPPAIDRPAGRSNPVAELTDPETGLLGEQYFAVTLDARVAAARRHLRPLSLVLIEVVGPDQAQLEDATVVADVVTRTLRDADTVCRLETGRFAAILEDTPENGAIWTVERIRRKLGESLDNCTVWAGVACYPAHGFDASEVLTQAEGALSAARDWRQDRTEVADG